MVLALGWLRPVLSCSPSQVQQRMAHGWFSWWICGIQMWQQLNGRPWISSLLRDDDNLFPCCSRQEGPRASQGRWVQSRPRLHVQRPASAESSHSGFFYHIESLFPLVIVNGKISACISLDFSFPFPSFASAVPSCLITHSLARRPEARCPPLSASGCYLVFSVL